jgi:hypothetical protein
MEAEARSGGGSGGGVVWRRRRRWHGMEAATASGVCSGDIWRLRWPLDEFSFVFLQRTAPIKLTAITVL